MKTLLVMRHAKSDWGRGGSSDHDRPLAARGIKAARRMGRFLSESGIVPDLIVSSTAARALQTAELASEAGDWSCAIATSADFYGGDVERVVEAVLAVDPEIDRLLITGHEPTWSSLVSWLMGGGCVRMPTAAVARLDLPVGGWAQIGAGSCELRWLVTPKMLG